MRAWRVHSSDRLRSSARCISTSSRWFFHARYHDRKHMIYVGPEWFLLAGAIFSVVNFTLLRYSKDGDLNNSAPQKNIPRSKEEILARLGVLISTPDVSWNISLGIALICSTTIIGMNLRQNFVSWCLGTFLIFFVQDSYIRWKTAHRVRRHVIECQILLDALK